MIKEKGNFDEIEVPRSIILPNSTNKIRWDIWIIVLVLYNIVYTPLDIGLSVSDNMVSWWDYVDNLIDLMFFLDIIFTFRTALIDEYGKINANTGDIARSYLAGWLPIDIIASLPLGII